MEEWKGVKECVKDENKDGFWVDLALDESGSMRNSMQYKALQATEDLIEELSNKVDDSMILIKIFILIFIHGVQT